MTGSAVPGQPETMREPAPRPDQRDGLAAAPVHPGESAPGADDQCRLVDQVDEGSRIRPAAHRIAGSKEHRRVARPKREKIADDQARIAPPLGEADAASNRRIVRMLVGTRRVEHDEAAEAFTAGPASVKSIAIAGLRSHSTQLDLKDVQPILWCSGKLKAENLS